MWNKSVNFMDQHKQCRKLIVFNDYFSVRVLIPAEGIKQLQCIMKYFLISFLMFWLGANGVTVAQGKNTGNIFRYEDKRFFGSIGFAGVASQVDGDMYGGYRKLGLTAGPSVLVQFHRNWVLQTGVWYTQKGSRDGRLTGSDLGTTIEKYKLNLHYIDVPVIVNYVFKETYLFGAGLAYNAYFSSKEVSETMNGTRIYDPGEFRFNRHSAELVLNAAAMANKNLMLYLRHHISITAIRDYRYTATGTGNQFNRYFTFGFAYLF